MIVVTGATGHIGRELVRILAEGGEQVTAVSRRPADVPDGVRHQPGDLAEPKSLRPAFEGADALSLLVAGEDPQGVLEQAEAAGIRRVVLLSSQGVATRPEAFQHPARFEAAVRRTGLEWTILRSGGLNSNVYAWAESIRTRRTVAAPFGDIGLPTVDPADIAEVAAAVLREPGRHAGKTYELNGPAPVTPRGRVEAIAAALGEPVRFVEQTREEARAKMLTFMSEPAVEGTLAILGDPLPAERTPTSGVERILGRPARSFADWAARSAPAFR
ncbi:SDR family oxidoreductase [Streptomyces sp. NPDC059979]|uniref:SDR family oxidoreductase n=1 Tax=unclassified Streptomyces TaxID=2593676 RepID=UPI00366020B4